MGCIGCIVKTLILVVLFLVAGILFLFLYHKADACVLWQKNCCENIEETYIGCRTRGASDPAFLPNVWGQQHNACPNISPFSGYVNATQMCVTYNSDFASRCEALCRAPEEFVAINALDSDQVSKHASDIFSFLHGEAEQRKKELEKKIEGTIAEEKEKAIAEQKQKAVEDFIKI